MATGYTYMVSEKDNVTFTEFAMQCARNFGALISMRDEPNDAPIPERFEPDDYYRQQYKKTKKAYEHFKKNIPTEEELSKKYDEYVARTKAEAKKINKRKRLVRRRYESMLAKVVAWIPPTTDHEGLKSFMIEQLEESIDFDCKEYIPQISNRKEYISFYRNGESFEKDLRHYAEMIARQDASVESRNKWLKELRDSLKEFEKQ